MQTLDEKKERLDTALRNDVKIRRVLGRETELQSLLEQGHLEREVIASSNQTAIR